MLKSVRLYWQIFAKRYLNDDRAEQYPLVRRMLARFRSVFTKGYFDQRYAIIWEGESQRRFGIYSYGSCDLPSIFAAIPPIRTELDGRCCLIRKGVVADSRSDLLLQTTKPLPSNAVALMRERLGFASEYFEPELFKPSFQVPGPRRREEFPKSAVILSIGADVTRSLYRHKDSGLLVDPGGWWLRVPMKRVLSSLDTAKWVQQNFEPTGMLTVEQFTDAFSNVAQQVIAMTGGQLLVLNVLTVEPGSASHNYQFVKDPRGLRRREFNIALAELSAKLNFSIVDVDRILKRTGFVQVQVDFDHYPPEVYQPIGQEIFRVLQEREVFAAR